MYTPSKEVIPNLDAVQTDLENLFTEEVIRQLRIPEPTPEPEPHATGTEGGNELTWSESEDEESEDEVMEEGWEERMK